MQPTTALLSLVDVRWCSLTFVAVLCIESHRPARKPRRIKVFCFTDELVIQLGYLTIASRLRLYRFGFEPDIVWSALQCFGQNTAYEAAMYGKVQLQNLGE